MTNKGIIGLCIAASTSTLGVIGFLITKTTKFKEYKVCKEGRIRDSERMAAAAYMGFEKQYASIDRSLLSDAYKKIYDNIKDDVKDSIWWDFTDLRATRLAYILEELRESINQ